MLEKAQVHSRTESATTDEGADDGTTELALIAALGSALVDSRKAAIDYRILQGIETDWAEDEEFYQAIDKANPEGESNVGRPTSANGGSDGTQVADGQQRSTAFIPITRSYVDAASARVADMLLPNDDAPWQLKATPVPEISPLKKTAEAAMAVSGSRPMPKGAIYQPGRMIDLSVDDAEAAGRGEDPDAPAGQPQPGPAAPATPPVGGMMGAGGPPQSIQAPPAGAEPGPAPAGPGAPPAGGPPGMPPGAPGAPAGGPLPGAAPGGPPQFGQPGATGAPMSAAPPKMPMGVDATALSDAEKAATKATEVITDWLVQCQWHAEVRKAIEDSAKLGTGIIKGPIPVRTVKRKFVRDPVTGASRIEQITEIAPTTVRVRPDRFFPDPACGDNHQRGSHTWEYDDTNSRELRALLKDDTYIRENILKVLREGPGSKWANSDMPIAEREMLAMIGTTFPMWYYYGDLDRKVLQAAGVPLDEMGDEDEQEAISMPALVIMVNDTVIKVAESPMECGGFPYDVFPWQRREGMIWGRGVARQMRTPQRMLNGAVRALMDNGALSSGPIWAIRKKWIKPIDGKNSLTPRKGFYMTEDAPENAKITDALSFINIECNIAELRTVIELAQKFGEDATGLPMLMQGQQGNATDTAAGMTILNNNGSTVLRRIARTFDDNITEPHIRRYYYWLLENEGHDEAKGDFQIDARGSTYLVERDIQNQALNQLAPFFAQHPDVHPGRFAEALAKANRLNYREFMLTAAEKQEKASQPPPPPPEVMVQMARDEAAGKRLEQTLAQKESSEQRKAKLDEAKIQTTYELGLGALQQKVNDLQAQLAIVSKELNVTVELSNAQRHHDATTAVHAAHASNEVATPPVEPPGRAPAGESYAA